MANPVNLAGCRIITRNTLLGFSVRYFYTSLPGREDAFLE